MVSNKNRPRPLWILSIHQRLSMNKFKRFAKKIIEEDKEDICYVLKWKNTKKRVYQVTVETMENCQTEECMKKIWVPEEFAQATGEMLEKFEDQQNESEDSDQGSIQVREEELEDDDEVSEEIEKEYEEIDKSETFDPYASDSDDSVDDDDDVLDFTVSDSRAEKDLAA